MPSSNRFAVSLLALVVLVAFAPHDAHASSRSARAKALAAQATSLMDKGKNFNQAAALLQSAIKLEPRNSRLHSLLGCAYADRAASITHALEWENFYAELKAEYPQDLADWRKAQLDPSDSKYHQAAPILPKGYDYPTKDDGKDLPGPPGVEWKVASSLAKSAIAEWTRGVGSAKSAKERAYAEYVYGCGLRLLLRSQDAIKYSEGDTPFQLTPINPLAPLGHLQSAAKLDSRSPVYWQAVGDFAKTKWYPVDYSATMTAAYQRALSLQPHNAALSYRFYDYLRRNEPGRADQLLRRAISDNPSVAQLHYDLATDIFHQTHFGDVFDTPDGTYDERTVKAAKESTVAGYHLADMALAEMADGNACRTLWAARYAQVMPDEIRAAWHYGDFEEFSGPNFPMWAVYRELARCAGGLAYVAAYNHDELRAMKAANLAVAMGYKVIGDWPVMDSSFESGDPIQAFVGIAIASIGYKAALHVTDVCGDTAAHSRIQAASDALQSRERAFRQAVSKHLPAVTDLLMAY